MPRDESRPQLAMIDEVTVTTGAEVRVEKHLLAVEDGRGRDAGLLQSMKSLNLRLLRRPLFDQLVQQVVIGAA